MKYKTQLIKLMKSKQGLMNLLGIAFVMMMTYAWSRNIIFLVIMINLLGGIVAAGVYCGWQWHQYGQPQWADAFKRWLARYIKQIKTVNWQKSFQRTARVSRLPLFLLIGPAGSGKTSLLNASEMHFTFGEPSNNTANNNVHWFANEAVFIDTSGSVLNEPEEWTRFINELKKSKTKSALKGVVLSISAASFVQTKESTAFIDQINKKIDELYRYLGIRLPIFLIITQCDRLTGFNAFCASLDDSIRQKIVGIELNESESVTDQLNNGLTNLYQRFSARLFKQIHMQPTLADKADFLQLPHCFQQLQRVLDYHINTLHRDSIYREKMRLAGVYFSSAAINDSAQKGCFIHDLFNKKLVGASLPQQLSGNKKKRFNALKKASYLFLAVGILTGIWALSSAYMKNSHLLTRGKVLAESGINGIENKFSPSQTGLNLNPISEHVYHLRHFNEIHPWFQRLGMVRVKSQLDLYETILAQLLKQTMYTPIKRYLANDLKTLHQQWRIADTKARSTMRGHYYTQLKLYLMLNFPQHIDLDFASASLARNWQQYNAAQNNNQELFFPALLELSRTYLEYLSQLDHKERRKLASYNTQIIAAARHDLFTSSGISNLFTSLEYQLSHQLGYMSDDHFFDAMDAELWQSAYQVPRFYSQLGYKQTVQKVFLAYAQYNAKKDWVIHSRVSQLDTSSAHEIQALNDKAQSKRSMQALNALYVQNYVTKWVKFIESVKAKRFDSYEEALQQLRVFYQTDGPFQQLFRVLNENFSLNKVMTAESYNALPVFVTTQISELKNITQSIAGNNLLLEHYLKQMATLQQDMERLSIGQDPSKTAQKYAERLLAGEGQDTELYKASALVEQLTYQINNHAGRQALKNLLLSPIQETYRAMISEAANGLQSQWRQDVFNPFQTRLSPYFPFNRHGQDANLVEFNAFFHPKTGIFAQFQNQLHPFLDKAGDGYTPKKWLGIPFPFTTEFLQNIAQINRLSKNLFPQGQNLSLHYAIYPIPTAGVKEILFSSSGQSYPYRNGPQEWVSFRWPGQDALDNDTGLRITHAFNSLQTVKEYQGAWGVFHLLASAEQTVKTARGYQLKWVFKNAGDKKSVQLHIKINAPVDLFELLLFKPLKLEDKMMLT